MKTRKQKLQTPVNHHFFSDIDSKEKAYALGFFVADGFIRNSYAKNYDVGFVSCDKEHLILIRDLLESSHKLYARRDKRSNSECYALTIGSRTMVNDIIQLGYDTKKSYTAEYPNIPRGLDNHFIRGVFDGDGCLSRTIAKRKYCYPQLDFNGTNKLMDVINERLPEHGCVRRVKENMWRIKFSCRKAFNILEWMYDGSECLRLERKHRVYLHAQGRTGFFADRM